MVTLSDNKFLKFITLDTKRVCPYNKIPSDNSEGILMFPNTKNVLLMIRFSVANILRFCTLSNINIPLKRIIGSCKIA
jgi:hypothetical protein